MGRPKIKIEKGTLERLYIHEQRSPKEIARLIGCNRQTIINRMRELGLTIRTKGEGTALAKILYPRKDFSGDVVEKAYLIGFRLGDLTVDMVNPKGLTIRVSCASTRHEQIDLIVGLFEKYGRVLKNGPYTNNRIFIQCLVNLSFSFLIEKDDAIPNWILDSNKTFWSFLGGYADAEAHFGISNSKASFRLGTTDENILKQIYEQFISSGIDCPKPYVWIRKGYVNKSGAKTNKDVWRLGVYRKESLRRLLLNLYGYLRHTKRKSDAEKVMKFIDV